MSLFLHRGGLLKPLGGGSTTETKDITANDDDGFSQVGFFFSESSGSIFAGTSSGSVVTAGLRFTGFSSSIKGANVSSATLTIQIDSVNGSPDVDVFGEDADSAAAWSSSRLPSGITKTTNSTNITPTATGSLDIDVTPIIQEIVDRGSYDETKGEIALALFDNVGSGTNNIGIEAFEKSGGPPASFEVVFS